MKLYLCACMSLYISGQIFQNVLAEVVQKGLILSQKGLISNRCNFGLFAPMRFPSKDSKSKDLFSNLKFLQAIFSFSQNALESLYYRAILTASSGQFLSYF